MLPRSLVIALVILAGQVVPARGQVTLEWKLNKGDRFFLRTISTVKQIWQTLGKETRQEMELTTVLGFKVEDKATDGNLVVKETLESFTMKAAGGEPVSDNRLQGVSVTLTLSPKMEVLKVEGLDQVLNKLAGEEGKVRESLQAVLSEDVLKKPVREILACVADRPVKVGETWERSLSVPFGPLGTITQTSTYKLEGKEEVGGKKVDKVSFTTAVDFRTGKADPSFPFQVMSGELKADDARGTLHFDTSAGRLVQMESRMTLKGRLIVSVSRTNVDAELQQEQTTKVTLLNENPVPR